MKFRLPLPLVVLLVAALAPDAGARSVPKLELPLILDSERALPLGGSFARKAGFSELDHYRFLPTHHYEPVGLHIDSNPYNIDEPEGAESFRDQGTGRGLYPIHELAMSIAWLSRRNVLLSARVEKRGYDRVPIKGTIDGKIRRLCRHLEENGVEVRLLGGDTYVLLEAPGHEEPFPYDRTRAVQYEKERESWLAKNDDYAAQGLIYQPTPATPESAETAARAFAASAKGIRVRHAAAWLAKATQKEVFVQAAVEKNKFRFPRPEDAAKAPFADQMTKQLDRADVKIIELGPRALALVHQ